MAELTDSGRKLFARLEEAERSGAEMTPEGKQALSRLREAVGVQAQPQPQQKTGLQTLAEKASQVVSPNGTAPVGFMQATKETLVPGSLESVKRLLNPNAGQFGLGRYLEQQGQKVGQAANESAQNLAEKIATSQFGQRNPKTSAALGAGLSTAVGLTSDQLTPSAMQQNLGMAGIGLAARPVGSALQKMAVDPARRALGFKKAMLTSTKSGAEALRKQAAANRAAETMLEEGVISKTGSIEKTASNVKKVIRKAGQTLNDVLKKSKGSIDSEILASKVIDKTSPVFQNQQKVVESMLADIQSMGGGKIPLDIAKRQLKERWGRIGYELRTVNTDESKLYRKAASAIEQEIANEVKNTSGKQALRVYKKANNLFGSGMKSLNSVAPELAAEMGNNFVSPVSMITAGAQMAGGNAKGALTTLSLLEAMRRRGWGVAANALYGGGKALKNITPGIPTLVGRTATQNLE